jgi:hypothetical protein
MNQHMRILFDRGQTLSHNRSMAEYPKIAMHALRNGFVHARVVMHLFDGTLSAAPVSGQAIALQGCCR